MKKLVGELTYRSWWYQVHWYGIPRENLRKWFPMAIECEEEEISRDGKICKAVL